MAREYIDLGPTPTNEDCEQLGPNYSPLLAIAECKRYIRQLTKQFGPPPSLASFSINANLHDFGTYYEVIIRYDDQNKASMEYAFHVENNLPEKWEKEN